MIASTVSMMPEDLEKDVSVQEIADLLGFLRQTIGTAQPETVTLFDEDPAFLEFLAKGTGQVHVDWSDRQQGELSMKVTPFQRFADRIPGWEYQIREHPEPGQFRYLRFAWKQPCGDGVMVELATDGKWPAANEPNHRFYSGRNTSEWQAVQIDSKRPEEWNVVTVDLWKNCGEFILTGIAPSAMGGEASFDRIELLRTCYA